MPEHSWTHIDLTKQLSQGTSQELRNRGGVEKEARDEEEEELHPWGMLPGQQQYKGQAGLCCARSLIPSLLHRNGLSGHAGGLTREKCCSTVGELD